MHVELANCLWNIYYGYIYFKSKGIMVISVGTSVLRIDEPPHKKPNDVVSEQV